jgi:hypothetical protein
MLSERFPQLAKFLPRQYQAKVAAGYLVRDIVRRRRQVDHIVTRYLRQAKQDVNARSDKARSAI